MSKEIAEMAKDPAWLAFVEKEKADRPAYIPQHNDEIHIYRNGRLVAMSPCIIEGFTVTSPLNSYTEMNMSLTMHSPSKELIEECMEAFHSQPFRLS